MGTVCSRNELPKTDCIELPEYEKQCKEMEKKLMISTLEIAKIENEIDEMEFKQKYFDTDGVATIYTRHGVDKPDFLAKDGVFMQFFPELAESEARQYFISSILPFCKGTMWEKREALWKVLKPENNSLNYPELVAVTLMMISLSTRVIPELVKKHTEKIGKKPNEKILELAECNDEIFDIYAEKHYPKKSDEGETIHRHEYSLWLEEVEATNLFSAQHHREALLKLLAERKTIPKAEPSDPVN